LSNSEELTKKRERQNNILERIVDRPVGYLIEHNVTPNFLSFMGFLCSLVAAFFLAIGTTHYPVWLAWPAPFFLIISGILDIFDGEVARRTGTESKAGAFLDSNLDRLSDAAIILGLIYGGLVDYILGFLMLFLFLMISYIRSRAENEGVNMKGVGLMERAERILILFIALIAESWVCFLTRFSTGTHFTLFFPIVMIFYTGLLIFTIGQRLTFTFKNLSSTETQVE